MVTRLHYWKDKGLQLEIQQREMLHKSYDVEFKLKAVAAAESSSKEAAPREFKVDP
uniref:Uncharacterized protein n=1 Tax=Amphimedon queenslandica TaxID=400682 RepID=A0A1X7TL29_AMPQE